MRDTEVLNPISQTKCPYSEPFFWKGTLPGTGGRWVVVLYCTVRSGWLLQEQDRTPPPIRYGPQLPTNAAVWSRHPDPAIAAGYSTLDDPFLCSTRRSLGHTVGSRLSFFDTAWPFDTSHTSLACMATNWLRQRMGKTTLMQASSTSLVFGLFTQFYSQIGC